MRKPVAESEKKKIARWPSFYAVLFLVIAILCVSTVIWMEKTQISSEETINSLGEFYLEEITERNAGNITSEIEKKAEQMEMALTVLDQNYLHNEESLREFIYMVQQVNGMDMFALVDDDGMVYTADSTFSGISRFGFLSEKITDKQIHMVKSYGTRTMLIIAEPVEFDMPADINIVSCFTGMNIESIISAKQIQQAENKTYCRLFTKDGENLLNINGEYPNGQNLLDILENTVSFASGYSLEKFKDDWENGREGYTVYYKEDAGNSYVYYKPVPGTDMIITSLMRESSINEVVKVGTGKMLRSSIIYLFIALISITCLFLIIIKVGRSARRSQMENEQFKIVGALSNDYSDIFIMEPLHDMASTMKVNGEIIEPEKREVRSYNEIWKSYVSRYVADDDAERILDTVSAENIYAKMKEVPEFSVDFRAKFEDGIHFYQMKFVKVSGEDDELIVGFRNNDAQMQAELERQKVLQDALAAAQHANRAKTTFLNNMSHDIRTPMNAIIGFTSLAAAHTDKPDRVKDYLSKIQTASSHLMSLINDVLDMSRIESGKVTIEEQDVNIPDLIRDLRTIVQADINSKQLEFFIDAADVINEDVICDRLRLNQILLNLLSNAIKFTKPGGTVSLRITQIHDAPKGFTKYEFRVKDTGIGMSREFREHIFEAFTRERSSTVSGVQGTGLGMAITKSIVDMMGGTISVDSEIGEGSEFTVKLQFRISGSHVKNEPVPEKSMCDYEGKKILLVEDNELNREIASELLQGMGFIVYTAMDGDEAVEKMKSAEPGQYDLILMDIQMPHMDGYEATRQIRKLENEEAAEIPIVAMTANAFEDDRQNAFAAGMNGHIAKPIEIPKLVKTLETVLK